MAGGKRSLGWRQQWRKGARVWGTWGSGRGELGSWPWQPWLGTHTRGRGRGMGDLSTEVSWLVREASGARISTGEGRGDDSWALQPGKTFGVLHKRPREVALSYRGSVFRPGLSQGSMPQPENAVSIRESRSNRLNVPFKVGSRPSLRGITAPLLADLIGIRRLRTVN